MGKAREGKAQLDHCGHLMLWVVSRKLQDILEDIWECLGKLRMPIGPKVGPLGWLLTPLVPDRRCFRVYKSVGKLWDKFWHTLGSFGRICNG